MNRRIVYTQQIPLSKDFLQVEKNALIAIGQLASDVMGGSSLVTGLACTPTSPASMQVITGAGALYQPGEIDATTFGSLAADTTTVNHQAYVLAASLLNYTFTAPTTTGQSVNYLIEAQFQSIDGNPVVLNYYNSANPTSPLIGQNGGGAAQNTDRVDTLVLQVIEGTPATTGSQVTPTVTAGWIPLYVVTVANGQTTIASGNIVTHSQAPFLPGLTQSHHAGTPGQAPQIKLTSEVQGVLPAANGGSGIAGTGSFMQRLISDPGAVSGTRWATLDTPGDMINVGLAASVASNALTATLTDKLGNPLSATNQALAVFRSATLALGTSSLVATQANISITAPAGATFGQANGGVPVYLYVVMINNGGSIVLGLTANPDLIEGLPQNTTAISTSSNSSLLIYTVSALSGVPVRYLGRILSTQSTAGTWATAPTEVGTGNQQCFPRTIARVWSSVAQSIPATTMTDITFNNIQYDDLSEFNLTASLFNVKSAGLYNICGGTEINVASGSRILSSIIVNGVEVERISESLPGSSNPVGGYGSALVRLNAGDSVVIGQYSTGAVTSNYGQAITYMGISRCFK